MKQLHYLYSLKHCYNVRFLLYFHSYLFRSGNTDHLDDKFKDTVIEILPNGLPDTAFVKVGQFDEEGMGNGDIPSDVGLVKKIRLKVEKESPNWVILSEVGNSQATILLKHLRKTKTYAHILDLINV